MEILDFIKPELFWLLPVLFGLGAIFKTIVWIPDENIPIINIAIAVVFSLMYCLGTADGTWFMAVYTGLAQGLLIGAAPTGVHQVFKQQTK